MPLPSLCGRSKLPKLQRLWNDAGKLYTRQDCSLVSPSANQGVIFRFTTSRVVCKAVPWRPRLDDVERISKGDASKVRGTGSRMVPHRLNQEERKLWEFAKKKGFLTVRGTGYRKERKGSPLANSWRQYCDAKEVVCVVIEQDKHGGTLDTIVVDVSTLRLVQPTQVWAAVKQLLEPLDVTVLTEGERPLTEVPFTVIPAEFYEPPTPRPAMPLDLNPGLSSSTPASDSDKFEGPVPSVEEAQESVEIQASVIRNLKAQGLGNKDPAVVAEVGTLLKLKEQLKLAEAAAAFQQVLDSSPPDITSALSSSPQPPSPDSIPAQSSSPQSSRSDHTAASSSDADTNTASTHPAAGGGSSLDPAATNPDVTAMQQTEEASAHASASQGLDSEEAGSSTEIGGQAPAANSEVELPKDHPLLKCAIWQIPSQPLFVRAARPVAKEVAAHLVSELPGKLKSVVPVPA